MPGTSGDSGRPAPRDPVLWIAILTTWPALLLVVVTLVCRWIGQRGGFDRDDTIFPGVALRILAAGFVATACIALPKPTAFSPRPSVRFVMKGTALLLALAVWITVARRVPDAELRARWIEGASLAALLFVVVIASRRRVDPDAAPPTTLSPASEDPNALAAWNRRVGRRLLLANAGLAGLAAIAFLPVLRPALGATTLPLPQFLTQREWAPLSVFEMSVILYGAARALQVSLFAPKGWRFARSPVMSAAERRAWRRNDVAISLGCFAAITVVLWIEATLGARAEVLRERVQPLAHALAAAASDPSKSAPKLLEELGVAPIPAGSPVGPQPIPFHFGRFENGHASSDLAGFAYRISDWEGPPARREEWLVFLLRSFVWMSTREGRFDLEVVDLGDARVVRSQEFASDVDGRWERVTFERD